MLSCCVCRRSSSRRSSKDEEDDDEDEDEDSRSGSGSEEDGPAEKRAGQAEEDERPAEEKEQPQANRDLGPIVHESGRRANEPLPGPPGPEQNGAGLPEDNKEAIKEEVTEIVNCAMKIVQEIRKGERERLEKIKEEEESLDRASSRGTESEDESRPLPNGDLRPEERCVIIDGIRKSPEPLREPSEAGEPEEAEAAPGEEPAPRVEIIEEIRKVEQRISEVERRLSDVVDESLLPANLPAPITASDEDADAEEEDEEEEEGSGRVEGELIPPPEDYEPLQEPGLLAHLEFPTPPPIDFDVDEGAGSDVESGRSRSRSTRSAGSQSSSRGTKSLPSPPSPVSETDNEGGDSDSNSDKSNQRLSLLVNRGSAGLVVDGLSIEDIELDEEGADDAVFKEEEGNLGEEGDLDLGPGPAMANGASPGGSSPGPVKMLLEEMPPRPVPPVARWLSQEDEDEDEDQDSERVSDGSEIIGGMLEPPATPVARDELALRRHRFFSDLLQAAQNSAEHRVRFDPLGPLVHPGCEHDDREEHLEELVTRLENVTKRLELVTTATHQGAAGGAPAAIQVQTQEIAVQTTKFPSPERSISFEDPPQEESSQSSSSSRESTVSVASVVEVVKNMSVTGFQDIVADALRDFLQLSEKIGGDVAEQGKLVDRAFREQLQFLQLAATRPAPNDNSEKSRMLMPTSKVISEVQDYREKHRGSPLFNHLSAISESIPALGWVAVAPTPAPYIKEMNDAGQFYTNRVLKEWKEKDKKHVEWCKAWVKTLTDLQQYVRQNHTTGLVWAKTGSAPAGGVPPPPPPCMMPVAETPPSVNDDRSALFAQINQGENITRNLKKVTSDMQTHKNTSMRTGPAPFKAPVTNSNSPVKTTLPANAPIDKPPVFMRDGKKWLIEYHKGNQNLVIDSAEMNNVIYMFRCQDSTLSVKGKVNSIVMDSCRKSSVVFDSVVSSVEFVNCQSVQMQVLGKVPTISIDKTDGCQMFLNKESLKVELITSKSSEMNIMVPTDNADYIEYPVPEQFKTLFTGQGLKTTAVDSLG